MTKIQHSSDSMDTCHSITNVSDLKMAIPMLVIGGGLVTITIAQQFFPATMVQWGFTTSLQYDVIEEFPDFTKAVSLRMSQLLRKENQYYKDKYAVQFIPEHVEDSLI